METKHTLQTQRTLSTHNGWMFWTLSYIIMIDEYINKKGARELSFHTTNAIDMTLQSHWRKCLNNSAITLTDLSMGLTLQTSGVDLTDLSAGLTWHTSLWGWPDRPVYGVDLIDLSMGLTWQTSLWGWPDRPLYGVDPTDLSMGLTWQTSLGVDQAVIGSTTQRRSVRQTQIIINSRKE